MLIIPINIHIVDYDKKFNIKGFKFRKITKEERVCLFNISHIELNESGHPSKIEYASPEQIFLNKPIDLYKDYISGAGYVIELDNQLNLSEIRILLLSFNLHKPGVFYVNQVFQKDQVEAMQVSNIQFINWPYIHGDTHYSFKMKELKSIAKIYRQLLDFRKDKKEKYEIIFDRYINAMSRQTNEKNAFVDFVGILESLIMGNNQNEITYRFSLITSYILSKQIKKTGITFTKMKEMYDIRSKLTHEGKSKKYSKEKLLEIYEYARLFLRWYIGNHDKNLEEIIHTKLGITEKAK